MFIKYSNEIIFRSVASWRWRNIRKNINQMLSPSSQFTRPAFKAPPNYFSRDADGRFFSFRCSTSISLLCLLFSRSRSRMQVCIFASTAGFFRILLPFIYLFFPVLFYTFCFHCVIDPAVVVDPVRWKKNVRRWITVCFLVCYWKNNSGS